MKGFRICLSSNPSLKKGIAASSLKELRSKIILKFQVSFKIYAFTFTYAYYFCFYGFIYTYTYDNTEQSRSRKKEVKENAGDVFSSKAQRKRAMMSWKVIAYFCKMELRSKMKSISLVFPHNHYLLCLTFPI